eukprot:66678_1
MIINYIKYLMKENWFIIIIHPMVMKLLWNGCGMFVEWLFISMELVSYRLDGYVLVIYGFTHYKEKYGVKVGDIKLTTTGSAKDYGAVTGGYGAYGQRDHIYVVKKGYGEKCYVETGYEGCGEKSYESCGEKCYESCGGKGYESYGEKKVMKIVDKKVIKVVEKNVMKVVEK